MDIKFYYIKKIKVLIYSNKDRKKIIDILDLNGAKVFKSNLLKNFLFLIISIFKTLFVLDKIYKCRYSNKNFFKLTYEVYNIYRLNPDLIITGLFTSIDFNNLSKIITSIRFVSIQIGSGNGSISFSNINHYQYWLKQEINEFWLLGEFFVNYFKNEGLNIKKSIVLGSISNSLYNKKILINKNIINLSKKYDVCIISNIKENYPNHFTNQIFYKNLYKVIIKSDLNAVFCGRYDKNNDPTGSMMERDYFNKYLGDKIDFIENSEYSTYELSDSSSVTIGDYTTAILESFARGNKIMISNPSNHEELDFYIDGIWTLKDYDSQSIKKKLEELINFNKKQWLEITEMQRNLMIKDANNTNTISQFNDMLD
ncbi:hypothetical protein N9C93_00290 [Pelagibacterales bacterium]|nr:hypothetical protein [Pelagibacterales bacterium]